MRNILNKIHLELINTGERPILNTKFEEIDAVLQFAYKFAGSRIKNADSVLDYGCGGGYGTEYLSRFTKGTVVGFDIDKNTISKNCLFYDKNKNLKFTFDKNALIKYDMVVSFQVIEHMGQEDGASYLADIKNSLNNGGTFFLATVNKNITSYELELPIMPFHIYEYGPWELAALLENYFLQVICYGQIDNVSLSKMKEEGWSYRKKNKEIKNKTLVFISQFEIVRFVARHLPVFLKQLFFGGKSRKDALAVEYKLTSEKEEIENSYITIYECKNAK